MALTLILALALTLTLALALTLALVLALTLVVLLTLMLLCIKQLKRKNYLFLYPTWKVLYLLILCKTNTCGKWHVKPRYCCSNYECIGWYILCAKMLMAYAIIRKYALWVHIVQFWILNNAYPSTKTFFIFTWIQKPVSCGMLVETSRHRTADISTSHPESMNLQQL